MKLRLIVLCLLTSCINNATKPVSKKSIDLEQIEGHWRCNKGPDLSYNELQISDSLYYYVDYGDYNDVGPVLPVPYKVVNDSFFWLSDHGRIRRSYKIIKIDSDSMILEHYGNGIERWSRFDPELEIKNWTREKDSVYANNFIKRRKENKD
ncbi:MAG: hypothetical protein ACI8ZN_002794 [Bacteroidia bacterium]|jgi:hypothetical protein